MQVLGVTTVTIFFWGVSTIGTRILLLLRKLHFLPAFPAGNPAFFFWISKKCFLIEILVCSV